LRAPRDPLVTIGGRGPTSKGKEWKGEGKEKGRGRKEGRKWKERGGEREWEGDRLREEDRGKGKGGEQREGKGIPSSLLNFWLRACYLTVVL